MPGDVAQGAAVTRRAVERFTSRSHEMVTRVNMPVTR